MKKVGDQQGRTSSLAAATHGYREFLIRLVGVCQHLAIWVIGSIALLTVGLLYYTTTHLVLDSDTMNMLAPDLSFRQHKVDFEKAFPQMDGILVIVIEAKEAAQARDVANQLTEKLQQKPNLYRSLYQPGQGPFFARSGFLYLGTEELWDVDEKLTEAEPFLGTVSQDPSLRGLFSGLGKAFDHDITPHHQTLLAKIFHGMSDTIEDQLADRASTNHWHDDFLDVQSTLGSEHRSFILIQPQSDYSKFQSGGDVIQRIRDIALELEQATPGVRIRLTGSVVMADEELGSVASGAGFSTVLSFVLVWILLHFGFRSGRLVLSILIALIVGLVWTAAFATLTIGHLNLISVTFPVLYIGLGVDFGIQFGMRYREAFAKEGNHSLALQEAASGVGGALTLAALAAAISFFSFFPTSYRGLGELGVIAGGGMFIALFVNLTLLPALLTVMPIQQTVIHGDGKIFRRLTILVTHNRRMTLGLTTIIIIIAVAILPQARFDFNPLNLKDPTTEGVATFLDLLQDPESQPYTISLLADDLVSAQHLARKVEQLETVDKAITLASYVPTDQEEKLDIIDNMNVVLQPLTISGNQLPPPDMKEEIQSLSTFSGKITQRKSSQEIPEFSASLLRLGRLLEQIKADPQWPAPFLTELEKRLVGNLSESLGKLQQLFMATQVTLDDLPQDIRDRYMASDGRARIQVFPNADLSDNAAMSRFVRSVQAVVPNATDTPVEIVEAGNTVVKACIEATVMTLVASFFLLVCVLASFRDAMLVLLPLILAVILTIASSAILSVPLNLANIIALPLLLGLGMAFGIYFVLRARSGLVIDTLFASSTPRAVFFSALTTMASFGTLAFSSHLGTASIGVLLTLSLFFALLCTLVVLPAILAELEVQNEHVRTRSS
jgi:hopanoid biosynthesis associated RND transporter like protein HpnN